jgi:hypothetical protein
VAFRLPGWLVRNPPEAWQSLVNIAYEYFQVEATVLEQSLVQRSPTDCDVSNVDQVQQQSSTLRVSRSNRSD